MRKVVNGVRVEMTQEEIDAFEASRVVDPEMERLRKLRRGLEPYQFHAMIEIIEAGGRALNIAQLIGTLPDVRSRAVARAKLNHAKSFQRTDPLVAGLSALAGLTPEEMDAFWLQALDL